MERERARATSTSLSIQRRRKRQRRSRESAGITTSAITVFVQFFLTGRLLKWLGVGLTLVLMPALSLFGLRAIKRRARGESRQQFKPGDIRARHHDACCG